VAETEWNPLIEQVVRLTRKVLHRNAKTGLWRSNSEFANSATSARQAAAAIRGHWHIENTPDYTRDVTFREDHSRIRHNSGIFVRLQSFVYHLLQRTRSSTFSHERYAAALGGLDALLKLCFS
jgi:hypothetical protein